MKEWECAKVDHYKDVGKTIEEYQRKGWSLDTYQVAGLAETHYLLFEKES